MTLSILVPTELAPAVAKRLKKLAESCGVSVTQVGGTTTLIKDARVLTCSRLTIGELPNAGGWVFVAKLEHLEGGNVVSRGPAERETDLVAWRTLPPLCSHCKTARHRKETFLLRSPEGELRQIARNCLADFVAADVTHLLRAADLAYEVSECMDERTWGGYSWGISPVAFIACAVASIEADGYRKSGEEGSTRAAAEFASGMPPTHPRTRAIWEAAQPTEAQIETAKATIAWLADHDVSGNSDYIWNLRLCIAEPDVGKHAGLLASAPVAYLRHLGKAAEQKADAIEKPAQGFAAPVKEVFQGQATLLRVNVIAIENSRFQSSKTICTFRAESGHELVWFATGSAPREIGERFQIKGRVKKHETYRGVDQTVLQRVSFKIAEEKA